LRHCQSQVSQAEQEFRELIEGVKDLPTQRTHEYGSFIIEAMETNQPTRINGNVPNHGLIMNLTDGCCVEVPCMVDSNGVQGVFFGSLPTQLAAVNRTNVNVQELAVEASLNGDKDAVHYAIMMDPLTSAVCTLPQIHALVDEMFAAQVKWLPQFQG
jgi:alpha-galactosidase